MAFWKRSFLLKTQHSQLQAVTFYKLLVPFKMKTNQPKPPPLKRKKKQQLRVIHKENREKNRKNPPFRSIKPNQATLALHI